MSKLKFRSDILIKRLSWTMVAVIVFDDTNTLVGQPASFWQKPETANEFNNLTHYFISHGWIWFCVEQLIYVVGAFWLARLLPRRLALVLLSALILGHFYGGSTWLLYRWDFGMKGMIIYAIILSFVLVFWTFRPQCMSKTEANNS